MAENQGIELRELDRISLDPSNFEPSNQRYYIILMYKYILILFLKSREEAISTIL